ncbi:activating transcription factor of chaperone isoform X1 [Microplitis demolitor]|uniref:activating transcription factor of chaperone isoform X1 n=1 Tax=Microplitis demolitor TaxID=69319 RepID=UPI0004CCDDA1|nr:activating transcription factor of chaperone isoform X1 [Microplitis demolitor]
MSLHEQWIWKAEPDSPSGTSIGEAEDDWISIDDKSSTLINDVLDPELYDENPTRAQVASKLLEQLDELVKEEPLPGWFEDRVESLFDELSSECIQSKSIIYPQPQIQSTPSFLQEFETVFGGVESCRQIYPSGSSALTPPQSPPMINTDQLSIDTPQIFVGLEPTALSSPNIEFVYPSTDNNSIITTTADHINQQPLQQLHIIQEESINKDGSSYLGQISGEWNAENVSLSPLAGDVASELAAVDEYVRSCAESISPSSPVNSTVSSYLSSEDSVDDPDWTIDSCTSSSKASSSNSNYGKRNQKVTRNRRKPYSRPIEDKKVRKKEQNKNAATRYRMKKKLEVKEIVGEQQELEDINTKLKDQVSELKREIGYLKGLMRDLFKAKGLIN